MSVNIEVIKCKYCGGSDMKRYGTYNGTQPESMDIELPFTSWLDIVKGTKGRVIKPPVQIPIIHVTAYNSPDAQTKRKYYAEAKRRQRARQKLGNPTSSIVVVPIKKEKP